MDSTKRFSDRVADYVRFRPGYPDDMVRFLVSQVGDASRKVCADIGSGTGILTRLLLPHFAEVIGVEPNADMRAAGEAYLRGMSGFSSRDGTAEDTGIDAQSVDLVTVAQAFHWFDREKFGRECVRILRPGAYVALIWNSRLVDTPFLAIYDDVLNAHAGDYREVNHRNITEQQLKDFFGGRCERKDFPNTQTFDLAGLFGRLDSSSYAPKPGSAAFPIVREALTKAFHAHAVDGKIAFNYRTELYLGRFER